MNTCHSLCTKLAQFVVSAAMAFAPGSILPALADAGERPRPNILLVTADDLGEQLSCYGEKNIATPQLDTLAAEGVRFANAYCAQSSCSSSRSSLLTGLWPHQNGQVGLANGAFLRMHPGQVTLPALLKKAGYRTGIIGKLHVWPGKVFPFDWMPAKEGMDPRPTRDVKWVAAQSRQFLSGVKQAGQPFFFYINYVDPARSAGRTNRPDQRRARAPSDRRRYSPIAAIRGRYGAG